MWRAVTWPFLFVKQLIDNCTYKYIHQVLKIVHSSTIMSLPKMFEDWLCGYSEIVGENRKILTSQEKCKRVDKISFKYQLIILGKVFNGTGMEFMLQKEMMVSIGYYYISLITFM